MVSRDFEYKNCHVTWNNTSEFVLPDKQKGCCRGSWDTKDKLLLEETVVRDTGKDTLIWL